MPKPKLNETASDFWRDLRVRTRAARDAEEILAMSALRRQSSGGTPEARSLSLAVIGGELPPRLSEILEQILWAEGVDGRVLTVGGQDPVAQILQPESDLYAQRPQWVVLFPWERHCHYDGKLTDSSETVRARSKRLGAELLGLCAKVHERTGAEILLVNFMLPAGVDPGAYRTRTLASDWSFTKLVNLRLGLGAPSYVQVCDLEFLSARRGLEHAASPSFQRELSVDIAREISHLCLGLPQPAKKVLVLDADNTLWGGVVADDGIDGIEIGGATERGRAFAAFQRYVLSLGDRGILLALCSKNDLPRVMEPFESHPGMSLRAKHLVAIKANWRPKPENLREMAAELNLGLDSFVFVDDNPAEIDMVRSFAPEVTALRLGPDPADYVRQLEEARLFEPRTLTKEYEARSRLYREEQQRRSALLTAGDKSRFLESLGMAASFEPLGAGNVARATQLLNKTNQFHLTGTRMPETELLALAGRADIRAFTFAMRDRYGDYGLVGLVVGRIVERCFHVDVWCLSCRVFDRQAEETILNEIVRVAGSCGCERVQGQYLSTGRNELVQELYGRLGFTKGSEASGVKTYVLQLKDYRTRETKIKTGPR